jgi:GNAT superfamily N-acetyltransferase
MASFIVELWSKILRALRWASPSYILETYIPSLRRNFAFVDAWALGNFVISVIALKSSTAPQIQWWEAALVFWAFVRIYETVVHQANVVLFDRYRALQVGQVHCVYSIERLVILAIQNYFEIIFWFAVVYRNFDFLFHIHNQAVNLDTFWGSLYLSLTTMTLLGTGEISPGRTEALIILILQTIIGLFMALVIISRFVALLPAMEQITNKDGKRSCGGKVRVRQCHNHEFDAIYSIINDAAQAYKGIIPADRWKEPYMPRNELRHEMDEGVVFWGYEEDGDLVGVMGIQHVQDVTLIRHAYVRPARQNQGIGGKLLSTLRQQTTRPVLIGTWADAVWAVRFYEKHGFRLVSPAEKERLLRKYWSIPARQVETSVVLADEKWFDAR